MATYIISSPIYVHVEKEEVAYEDDSDYEEEEPQDTIIELEEADMDYSLVKNINDAIDDFNQANLQQYFEEPLNTLILDMTLDIDPDCTVRVNTSRKLTKEEMDNLVDELAGQFSDGWGESMSQFGSGSKTLLFWTSEKYWQMTITEDDN